MDYVTKIKEYAARRRVLKAPTLDFIWASLYTFYEDKLLPKSYLPSPDEGGVKQLADLGGEVVLECQSVYTKPVGTPPEKLEEVFGPLPESFKNIYRNFSEVLFVTRGWPVAMRDVEWIMDAYDTDSYEGEPALDRFFRFADYPGENPTMYYGLRKNEFTDAWEVVFCTYALLYNEMIGPEGRDAVVASSFEQWLEERWLERDGKPDYIGDRIEDDDYAEALPDDWRESHPETKEG